MTSLVNTDTMKPISLNVHHIKGFPPHGYNPPGGLRSPQRGRGTSEGEVDDKVLSRKIRVADPVRVRLGNYWGDGRLNLKFHIP